MVSQHPHTGAQAKKGDSQFLQFSSLTGDEADRELGTTREAIELEIRIFSWAIWMLEPVGAEASSDGLCFILLCCPSPFSEAAL